MKLAATVESWSAYSFKAARGEFSFGVPGSAVAAGLRVGAVSMWGGGTLPGASCPNARSGAVLGSPRPIGKRSRRKGRGRFKEAAGRGRRPRSGWLARSRQSAARGPAGAGAALPPPAGGRARRWRPRV